VRLTGNVGLLNVTSDSNGASTVLPCAVFKADASTNIYMSLVWGGVTGTPNQEYSGAIERLQ
jgi:hypothetical protein